MTILDRELLRVLRIVSKNGAHENEKQPLRALGPAKRAGLVKETDRIWTGDRWGWALTWRLTEKGETTLADLERLAAPTGKDDGAAS